MAVNIVCLRIHSQVQSEGLIPFICSFMPPLLHFTHKTQDPSQTSQIELHTNTGMFHVNSGRVCCSGCMSPRVLMGMSSRYMSPFTALPPSIQRGHGCMGGTSWVLQRRSGWVEVEVGRVLYVGSSVFPLS